MIRRPICLIFAAMMMLGHADAFVAIPPVVATPEILDAAKVPEDAAKVPDARSNPTSPTPARPAPPANPLWGIPFKQLSNTRERPLFSPSRRPPPPVVASAPSPPPTRAIARPLESPRPQLSLIGTVIGSNESIGIFVDEASKAPVRLRVGEAHQGWMLRTVQGREITLENGRETVTLALPAPGSERTTSAPAAPPPPSPGRTRAR
jgi:hypothetical protein